MIDKAIAKEHFVVVFHVLSYNDEQYSARDNYGLLAFVRVLFGRNIKSSFTSSQGSSRLSSFTQETVVLHSVQPELDNAPGLEETKSEDSGVLPTKSINTSECSTPEEVLAFQALASKSHHQNGLKTKSSPLPARHYRRSASSPLLASRRRNSEPVEQNVQTQPTGQFLVVFFLSVCAKLCNRMQMWSE